MKINYKIFSVVLVLLLISCTNSDKKNNENRKKSDTSVEIQNVEVIPTSLITFKKQIITNGKLSAIQKADIYFKTL